MKQQNESDWQTSSQYFFFVPTLKRFALKFEQTTIQSSGISTG